MKELFEQNPYAFIALAGYCTCIALFLFAMASATLSAWRQQSSERRRRFYADYFGIGRKCKKQVSSSASSPNLHGRIALIAVLAVLFTLVGCGTLGGGKLNPGGVTLIDLSELQIGLAMVGPDGTPYSVTRTQDGNIDVQAEFTDPHGNVYTLGEGVGNITVRNPETGLQLTIKPKIDPRSNLDPDGKMDPGSNLNS